MKRAILITTAVLAVAACSSDDTTTTTTTTATTATTTTATTPESTSAPAATTTIPATTTTLEPTTTTIADAAELTAEIVDAYTMEPIRQGLLNTFDLFRLDADTVVLSYTTTFGSNDTVNEHRETDAWMIAKFIADYDVGLDLTIDNLRFVASPDLMATVAAHGITAADWVQQAEQT